MPKHSIFTSSPEVKQRQVAENKTAFAFLTNIPITPGHTLVSPKRVVASFDELTEQERLDILSLAEKVKSGLRRHIGAEGFNYAWNEGAKYGQSVPHFHLHIVPRTPNDDGIYEYEPRKFLYRPGSRAATPEEELSTFADELSNAIQE